jgi:hypothetical protein
MSESCLFKAFRERQYAEEFLDSGRMRFAMPSTFGSVNMPEESIADQLRVFSDPRFDVSDGTGGYVDKNGGKITALTMNPTYIFCCAQADVDLKHLITFGTSIVKVSRPERILSSVIEQIRLLEFPICDEPKWVAVRYDKGIRQIDSSNLPLDEGLCQKPPEYALDKEIRLIIQLFNREAIYDRDCLFIEIGNVRSFCELIAH